MRFPLFMMVKSAHSRPPTPELLEGFVTYGKSTVWC